jgi:hypothetical protein
MTRILESTKQLRSDFTNHIIGKIVGKLGQKKARLRTDISTLITSSIVTNKTVQELLNSDSRLVHELGFHAGTSPEKIMTVIDTFSKDVEIILSPKNPILSINWLPQDNSFLYSLSQSYIVTEKGFPIPWLSWLLEAGNKFLITKYSYLNKKLEISRSSRGIMIKDLDGFWKVPSQHSGTKNNNFLTRSFNDQFYSQLDQLIWNYIK